jgi:hypothetical protein
VSYIRQQLTKDYNVSLMHTNGERKCQYKHVNNVNYRVLHPVARNINCK